MRKGSYHHGKNGSDAHLLDTVTLPEVAIAHQSPLNFLTSPAQILREEIAI